MDFNSIHYLNLFLGSGAILLQIISVVVLLFLFLGLKKNVFLDFINEHFLLIGFLLTFFSTLLSLFYSEIVNFLPCSLCWYQRIFMFPLVFIFAVAMYFKDRNIIKYIFPLTFVGSLFALYQNFFYYFGESSSLPCDASGISCYQRLISEFGGYISFPMFSITIFFAILTLLAVAHFYKKVASSATRREGGR